MAASMSKTMRLSSLLKIDRDALSITRKQGIVSVLGSDHSEKTRGAASLRRTLSADMSSQKWLAENSFSPAKNTASSEEFPVLQEEEDELSHGENEEVERDGESEIWSKIQEEKQKNSELGKASNSDLWTSILSLKEKNESSSASFPTYIHSLVNRSKSCLSLRSLEICTERLGSETDSDMVSSYPSSETEVCDEEKGQQEQGNNISGPFEKEAEFEVAKYSCSPYSSNKSSSPRSFPPPLTFLSRDEGGSMHMQSRRENGRLVLEVVSVGSQTNLIAQREDGRLVLTYVNDPNFQELENEVAETEVGEDVFDEEFNYFENDEGDDDREEEVEEEEEIKNKKIESSAAKYQPWTFPNPNKFSEVDIEEGNGEVWGQLNQSPHSLPPLAQLLAPPSTVAVLTSSLNGNENWLRKKPLEETCEEGKVVAPFIGGCKELRRSLLCWETLCIATS